MALQHAHLQRYRVGLGLEDVHQHAAVAGARVHARQVVKARGHARVDRHRPGVRALDDVAERGERLARQRLRNERERRGRARRRGQESGAGNRQQKLLGFWSNWYYQYPCDTSTQSISRRQGNR
ncbi:hypothetical protein FQZ97_958890 [compost metagenome]